MFLFEGGRSLISCLFHKIEPLEISEKPEIRFKKVDFPAPEGPITAYILSDSNERLAEIAK